MKYAYIENEKLYIKADSSDFIAIDTIDNIDAVDTISRENHTYSFERVSLEVINGLYYAVLNIPEQLPDLDLSAFFITVDETFNIRHYFFYNPDELDKAEAKLLLSYCSTCLDKHQKEQLVLFNMKYMLLEYAADQLSKLKDRTKGWDIKALERYNDLIRTIGIGDKSNVSHTGMLYSNGCASCSNNKKCCCSNGCCSLCQ